MKSIRSLFYREMRLSARHYMIRLLLLVLVVGFAALSLLVTGQNSAYAGEDMSGFTVMLTYIIAVIAGVVISEDNGVFKADMDAGWLRYSYALPMSAAKKALTRTLVKLLSVVVGMVVIVAGAAAVRGMNGSSLDLKTILYFVLILDVFLLYDMVQQIFILGSAFEGAYNIGDRIEIQSGDISQSYEVTGFVQSVNYQGNVCEFSLEGYKALNSETFVPTLYVYLNDAADTEKIIDEIEQSYGDKIVSTMNYQKMAETTQEMYSGITTVIVVVIFILTILIVLFVLYIVIKILLVQRKQELGIYKAIGYSNKQLMVQMIGSFLPSSVAAVLLSSVLGLVYVPQINQFIFQTIGAMKNNMEVSFAFLMIFAFVQITADLIISILLTRPIKKISAYALIKEG